MKDVFWITAGDSERFVYVSPSFEQVWGRPCTALYESAQCWLSAIHPDDHDRILQAMHERRWRGRYDETYRIQRPDGTTRCIRDRAVPIHDASGSLGQTIGLAEDVTDARGLDEQLMHAQRLETVGALAAGVVHDINNVLSVIEGFGCLLATANTLPPDMAEAAEQIVQAAERGATLARQLLRFGGQKPIRPVAIDLNDVVRGMIAMLGRIVGEQIDLAVMLDSEPLVTNADRGALEQVLMNLVTNARDAMPAGGRVKIETGRTQGVANALDKNPDIREGVYVFVRVTDSGSGIGAESLIHIYEPFFTTKASDLGTGLGLFTVARVVKQHGGCIRLDTHVGRGSSFEICLPAQQKVSEEQGGTSSCA